MNYSQYSASRRKKIEAGLRSFFTEQKKNTLPIRFHPDVMSKLLAFSLKGKLMRGIFVYTAYEMCHGTRPKSVLGVACAIEIMHTGLLIHDDIMDQDELRRGMRTIYMQYADEATRDGFASPKQYGMSLGISAGDVGFFLAHDLLYRSIKHSPHCASIMHTFSKEMVHLGAAQMEDVYLGNKATTPRIDEVICMYLYKSARYSFSLPFEMGARLAGAPQATVRLLSRLGEQIGIIFQIKDDEIGLFETAQSIGKSVGIDIISNKKTLHRYFCMQSATHAEQKKMERIFGNTKATKKDIQYVMQLMMKYNIREQIAQYLNKYEKEAYKIIKSLNTKGYDTTNLKSIVELNLARTK